MKKRLLLLILVPFAVLAAEKPNILVIVSDDQGYADAGFQGSKEVPMPTDRPHDGVNLLPFLRVRAGGPERGHVSIFCKG